jgi:hypothetical protein
MARRRLIVVTSAALAAFAAYWLHADRLTPEEERLVGTWHRSHMGAMVGSTLAIEFNRDHHATMTYRNQPGEFTENARWQVRNGQVLVDTEPSAVRRGLRPLLDRLGIWVESLTIWDVSDFDMGGTTGEYDEEFFHRVQSD